MERPLLFAPAMNKHMWLHPLTALHVSQLRSFGYEEIPVADKTQLCGDKGKIYAVVFIRKVLWLLDQLLRTLHEY